MSSPVKFITLILIVLLISSFSPVNQATGSDQPKPHEDTSKIKAPKDYDTPKFFVPPPPFSEDIFPCSECHADMDVDPERRELEDMHEEISEIFNHASDQRWCLDCHNPDNRDVLRLANGDLVAFEESYNLCGQCHGTIFRDWKAGIHGKRTGEWNGKKQYRLCVHCHNPHSPRFKPVNPLPPPDKPLEIEYKKLKDEDIPRNPLGDIQ
jgi:hypothetical protein